MEDLTIICDICDEERDAMTAEICVDAMDVYQRDTSTWVNRADIYRHCAECAIKWGA